MSSETFYVNCEAMVACDHGSRDICFELPFPDECYMEATVTSSHPGSLVSFLASFLFRVRFYLDSQTSPAVTWAATSLRNNLT